MSLGHSFDELLREAGYSKQADNLLIATHKEPKDPNQPAGISFSEYRSLKLELDKKTRKMRIWKTISAIMTIMTAFSVVFSAYYYDKRYADGAKAEYQKILYNPEQYCLIHTFDAVDYVTGIYSLEELASQYGTKTEGGTSSTSVYVTQSGSKYHKSDCRILKGKDGVTEYAGSEEAEKHGYSACEICNQ